MFNDTNKFKPMSQVFIPIHRSNKFAIDIRTNVLWMVCVNHSFWSQLECVQCSIKVHVCTYIERSHNSQFRMKNRNGKCLHVHLDRAQFSSILNSIFVGWESTSFYRQSFTNISELCIARIPYTWTSLIFTRPHDCHKIPIYDMQYTPL